MILKNIEKNLETEMILMKDIDKNNKSFEEIKHIDGACEFIFDTKNIIKITCKLISKYNDIEYKTLYINN